MASWLSFTVIAIALSQGHSWGPKGPAARPWLPTTTHLRPLQATSLDPPALLPEKKGKGSVDEKSLQPKDFFPLQQALDLQRQPAGVASIVEDTAESKKKSENEWFARLTLICVAAFYGTNFGCVKILGEALDPSAAAAMRFSLAATVFLPPLIKHAKTNPPLIRGGLEVGLYSFLGYWAQAHSLETSSASTAAFICSLAVIVVPLLDAAFGGQNSKSTNAPWYAPLFPAVLAAAGVGCLELGGSTAPGVGDLWAVAQPLFFGLGFWRVEAHMKHATQAGEAQAFTGAMMATVAACSWLWTTNDYIVPAVRAQLEAGGSSSVAALASSVLGSQLAHLSDWHVALAILWTGIMTTAITSYGENMAMKSLSSAETTVIFSTEPLWGTAFAAVALGETVGPNVFFGAGLILGACIWSSVAPSFKFGIFGGTASLPLWAQELGAAVEEVVQNARVNLGSIMEGGVGEGLESLEDKM